MENTTFICRLEQIGDPGSLGFRIRSANGLRDIMVIRRDGAVYGYVNSCPHTGACLDWQPGDFLNLDHSRIICATHGAEFRIEDGHCVAGPCAGDALEPIDLTVDASGRVFWIPGWKISPRNDLS